MILNEDELIRTYPKMTRRIAVYLRQTRRKHLTPRQYRRCIKKLHRGLGAA